LASIEEPGGSRYNLKMKNIPHNWYEFSFGKDYLQRYAHRDNEEARRQVHSIVELLNMKRKDRLLDLCSGAGRHLKIFKELGFQAVGLDLSEALLKASPAPVVRADQRFWPFAGGSFQACCLLFTSLGYFEEDAENFLVFDEMARCLELGGGFLIDLPRPDFVREHLIFESEKKLPGGLLKEKRWFRGKRVCKEMLFVKDDASCKTYHESVRLYDEKELKEACRLRGLSIRQCREGLLGEKGRQVLVGEKA
jgi:SAM-dependent methyltransferase